MRRRVPRSRVGHDRWLVSYADFVTLLFGLFVVLYAFARTDEKKHLQVTAAINSAFDSLAVFPGASRPASNSIEARGATDRSATPTNIVMRDDLVSPAKVREDLDHVKQELERMLSNEVAKHAVSIQMGRDGLVISLREAGFFASGSATPRPESLATLVKIGASLGRTSYDLRIEGHTDNVPIHTSEFDSNWELSSARATRIARLFLAQKTIPPDHLSSTGYAEFHPVASNDVADGRAKNRRVDLVVLPRTSLDLSKPQAKDAGDAWHKITDD